MDRFLDRFLMVLESILGQYWLPKSIKNLSKINVEIGSIFGCILEGPRDLPVRLVRDYPGSGGPWGRVGRGEKFRGSGGPVDPTPSKRLARGQRIFMLRIVVQSH